MALWTATDVAGILPKYLQVGRLLKINVTNGGTGYTNGASVAVTIGAPGAGGVQATATAVVTGGVVQSITLTNPGTIYATAPSVTMATGTGLTVSVVLEPIVYDATKVFFVDETEAQVASNRSKGIVSPGWWYVNSYSDSDGNTRYKSEQLVFINQTAANAGDSSDDSIVPDVSFLITIGTQPTDQTASSGNATFTAAATVAPSGSVTYQWQVAQVGSNKFTNIGGATSASLALTGLVSGDSGKRYRVKVSATSAKDVVSNVVTLTV